MSTRLSELLRQQATSCEVLGSPLYAFLLARADEDVERGGVVAEILASHENDPEGSALALRLMGAVHRLVLEGTAPVLARHYPSFGGSPEMDSVWNAFVAVVAEHRARISTLIDRPVQTNEPGRSAALLGAFLVAAERTGMPLTLLEVGASAGLNLLWDRYRYEGASGGWGDPRSPVRFEGVFVENEPPLHVRAQVLGRAGCDIAPLDPRSPEGRLTLMSYVWPDQTRRLAILRAAIDVAKATPVAVERASAAGWIERSLAPAEGACTVVFHSIVRQYLPEDELVRMDEAIERAGTRATDRAPIAHVAFEPRIEGGAFVGMFVSLRLWPDGNYADVARASAHGVEVTWLAD